MSAAPVFPPLMTGRAAEAEDPFLLACEEAESDGDPGLLVWRVTSETLSAALVLVPESLLEPAMAGFIACAVGLQNALGALAPPETAVHLDWSGGIILNGAEAGRLRVAAPSRDPAEEPDWLVVGFDLALSLPPGAEPGESPGRTALDQEGCGGLDPLRLLEAWSRHTLLWLNALDDAEGRADLHREWQGLAWKLGETVAVTVAGLQEAGRFLGADENFGMLIETGGTTRLIRLSALIEEV
ncbi:biotin/lipoate--protein ligase family protein [Defluviimonas salinarum]|uniref:DUF4444 domain-containing protein n=1 Tax=Defluviimonas salinarum TaxID=2992147 RepID=A0ABT3IX69_9RHOB|nr:biotin/lipoate--protein ligase family protein [Defluviimonas salinarum]MCW3780030.1 DUF4444 domain-containing protein [Defluviimonas salinarum]